MSSQRTLHALLIVFTILALGVASIGVVISSRKRAREAEARPPAEAPLPPRAGSPLEKPPASAPSAAAGAPKALSATSPVVIPPKLALKFEKRYREVSPSAMQLARSELEEKLRVQTQSHAPEASLQELRCEIQWIAERTVSDEGAGEREEEPR
jgi:hypothetical protein